MKLEGKVAVITGAASGIGRSIAEAYAREGAKVVVADIKEEQMKEVVEGIRAEGGTAASIVADVRDQDSNDAMLAFAVKEFGRYDILVCNAGIMDGFEPIGKVSDETWNRVWGINTLGPMMQIRSAVNFFEGNNGGVIIVVASVAALGSGRAGAAYTASKRATVALAQNTAYAYAKKNIRVNVIAPGGVKTNIAQSMTHIDPEGSDLFNAGAPLMPRTGNADEVADVALFLASEDAHFVNGAVIPVDGGWNAY